ncbi:hypothetical protein BO94DRAFT_200858 [Aspergillus sclerotioniger CBS 115572]|uniref:Uncharacterized protein n=1 Tax=Aspergillus sclerotioniger CBS 115572 TaxID=1450535 RepID=A0A317VS48_9EURO|nr:hypothetical protein BO94DRAFT_200858 [Aspergillus sclerotioniger CBS 115572]PWY76399.1 hypothetical protein BO94DRAFT_200858 [Aspergillus sclerotioniger CBS 115572]
MYPFPPLTLGCTACLASCRSCVSLANQCGVAALHDHRQAVVRHESVHYYCQSRGWPETCSPTPDWYSWYSVSYRGAVPWCLSTYLTVDR